MSSPSQHYHRRSVRLGLELLDSRDLPSGSPAWAIGAAPGGEPRVWVYDADNQPVTSFLAYEPTFTGGVRVAVADLNGDDTLDVVTGPGPGGGPRVRSFDGATGAAMADFFAYEQTFTGGVRVAAGPIDSGEVGIATGADAGGGPRVRVFEADGTGLQDFFAFDQTFTGGVRVALGQSGTDPSVYAAGGSGMVPTVRAFEAATGKLVSEQAAGDEAETDGVWVTAGDISGDGLDEVLTAAGFGTDTELRLFDGANGMWVNQVTVSGTSYGVGILDWDGQPAVGVLGASGMNVYTLGDFGAAPTLLGQAGGSGWGGSSVGGRWTPSSPYPLTIALSETMWYSAMVEGTPDQLKLQQEVKQVSDEEFRWALKFTNTSWDNGPGSLFQEGADRLDLGIYHLPDILRFETPNGWTATKGSFAGNLEGMGFISWETAYDFIMPGQSRTFVFYTPVRAITSIGGTGHAHFRQASCEGPGIVPDLGPKIVITYHDGSEATQQKGLRVAKWQDAFQLTANGVDVEVRGPDANNWDFIDRDPDRFNVWVYDKPEWDNQTAHIQAKISTKNVVGFTMYDDPQTPIDLVRYTGAAKNEPGWYWSDSQLLVSNESDDTYSDAKYLGADEAGPGADGLPKSGGYIWKISDRTHRVALRGTVKADYTTVGGVSISTSKPVPVEKNVKVHPIILRKTVGGDPVISVADANKEIHHANEQYAQVRILLIPSTPQIKDPPAWVNLGDNLTAWTKFDAAGKIQITDEEAALLIPDYRTEATDDVELYFITQLSGGINGEAFTASTVPNARYEDSAIIGVDTYGVFTIPHEIGHVLLDSAPPDIHYSGPLRFANLMNSLTNLSDGVAVTKRLTPAQETDMLSKRPNLLTGP